MKELDFDELDRAVSSLMGGASAPPAAAKDDKNATEDAKSGATITSHDSSETVLEISSSSSHEPKVVEQDEARATSKTAPSPEKEASSTPAAPSPARQAPPAAKRRGEPLAARRSGRFMDVVHPSSDMKQTLASPSSAPSRRGVTIPAPSGADTETAEAEVPAKDVMSPVVDRHDTTPVETEDWPDPLAGFDAEAVTMPSAAEPETESVIEEEPEPEMPDTFAAEEELLFVETPLASSLDEDEQQPLTSPFLADAKVDKRPLGGAMAEETLLAEEDLARAPVLGVMAEEDGTTDNPDDQLPPTIESPDVALPEELRGDVMSIESDATAIKAAAAEAAAAKSEAEAETTAATGAATPAPTPSPAPAPAPTRAAAPVQPAARQTTPPTRVAPSPAPTSAPQPETISEKQKEATGPSSIQPQYKEAVSSGDQSNGSIYDTRGYHQPLSHPAPKKSGWLWIVWVLLILLAGAGGGAALYLLDVI